MAKEDGPLTSKQKKVVAAEKRRNDTIVRDCTIVVMLGTGLPGTVVAELMGVHPNTITNVAQGRGSDLANQIVEALRSVEHLKLTKIQHRILDSIDDKVIEKASLQQRMVSAGIAQDKRDGHQITINHRDTMSDEQILARMEEIAGTLKGNLAQEAYDAEYEVQHPRDPKTGKLVTKGEPRPDSDEWRPPNPKAIPLIGDDDEQLAEEEKS